jgi:ornithine cyclodeaminase/alanine dehydrogenase-like protein (mu-crystallin family)
MKRHFFPGRQYNLEAHMKDILYLNNEHLEELKLDKTDIVNILETMFRQKAEGATQMPPKVWFYRDQDRFFSAMTSSSGALGYGGCKWQSGDPQNPSRGLPYIQGLYILSDEESGEMLAIMDAKWITGQRTAAASALVARYQVREGAQNLAILGCGLQGRAHLEVLAAEIPSLKRCRVYDVKPDVQNAFVAELSGKYNDIEVIGTVSAQKAIEDADLIITGGPIESERRASILPAWIKPGALVITIDYDSYVSDECIAAMDIVITDDYGQIEDARTKEEKFAGVQVIDADIAQLIASGQGRRQSDEQRILAFNLGIALEDLATAVELYQRALNLSAGIYLPA